jgi:hypothetical protein
MRRAAVSIPSNVAEGHASGPRGRYLYHVRIALGSLAELETQLADTVKARVILADGHSERVAADGRPIVRSQERLYEVTTAARDDARAPHRSSEPSPLPQSDPLTDREEGVALVALRNGERARASAAQETADALLSGAD